MEIVRIFDNHLFSFKFENENLNEYERLFDNWNDIEFLENFFDENKEDLNCDFCHYITIEQAILKTRKEAQTLISRLSKLSNQKNQILPGLDSIFQPLKNTQTSILDLNKSKVKQEWLRLYALKIEHNAYIITGGAIKLTLQMEVREHTNKELSKLETCRRFLLNDKITDIDGIIEVVGI